MNGYKVQEHLNLEDFSNNRYIGVVKSWDETGYIDKAIGEELQGIIDDDDYVLGIHRTGHTHINPTISDPNLQSIFKLGLTNNGDMMLGANSGKYDIEKTVTLIQDPLFLAISLKTVDDYKNSTGCIVVKIPKSYLGKKDGYIMPIYYNDSNIVRLLPEFVYGYIPVSNHRIETIIRNPNYKDTHYIINENSAYDDSVSSKYSLPYVSKISLADKYNIIYKASVDTLYKYGINQVRVALNEIINNNNFNYFTGKENKLLLSQHLIFSDIKKVLAY